MQVNADVEVGKRAGAAGPGRAGQDRIKAAGLAKRDRKRPRLTGNRKVCG